MGGAARTGLIGCAIARALVRRGHTVVCGVRKPDAAGALLRGCRLLQLDFGRLADGSSAAPPLDDVDVLINAVGIFADPTGREFQLLHADAPIRLFDAAARAGVGRVVQISALGVDEHARSAYHLSKRMADDALLALPVCSLVVQPSLVFAPQGRSTRFLTMWATLPLVPLPGDGVQLIQPVHLDDLDDVVMSVALSQPTQTSPGGARVPVVGAQPLTLRAYLALLRRLAGGAPVFVQIPRPLLRLAATVGAHLPGSLISTDALDMLERGNVAPVDPMTRWRGRAPQALSDEPVDREGFGAAARLRWLLPLLRVSLATVWIWTAIVSAGLYPVAASDALLARVGAPAELQPSLLYGAAVLDLALGVFSLWWPARRLGPRARLWFIQVAYRVLHAIDQLAFIPNSITPMKPLSRKNATTTSYIIIGPITAPVSVANADQLVPN